MGCGASKQEKKDEKQEQKQDRSAPADDEKPKEDDKPKDDSDSAPPPAAAAAPPPPAEEEKADDDDWEAPDNWMQATEVDMDDPEEEAVDFPPEDFEDLDSAEAVVAAIKEGWSDKPKMINVREYTWSAEVFSAVAKEFGATVQHLGYNEVPEETPINADVLKLIVSEFPNLVNLHLATFEQDGTLTDDDVKLLEPVLPRLKQLVIRGSAKITDASVPLLKKATNLVLVDVAKTGITPDGFVDLASSLRKVVYFVGPEGMDTNRVKKVFATCPRVMECEGFDDPEAVFTEDFKEAGLPKHFNKESHLLAHLFPELHEEDEEEEGEEEDDE